MGSPQRRPAAMYSPAAKKPHAGSGIRSRELVAFITMSRETARRLFVLLLSVAVAAGLMARVVQASAMDNMTMVAMAADMPMHGKCDGCAGNEKAMTPAACGVYCSSVIALTPISVAFDLVPVDIVTPSAEAAAIGHVFPPDPYPPRPTGMN